MALQNLAHALTIDPSFVPALILTAEIFRSRGQYPLSIKYYKKALSTTPCQIIADLGLA